jgi:hypothetical protein
VNPFWNGECNFCGKRGNPQTSSIKTTQYGTVEYEVGGPYVTRKTPVQPIFRYALDATCPNLPSYIPLIRELGNSMAEHHERQTTTRPEQLLTPRIALCLVGSFGVVICYLDDKDTIAYCVMSDVTEQPFCPMPIERWTHDVLTGLEQWTRLLDELWDAWQPFLKELEHTSAYGPRAYELSCGGAALAFMADALAETGGRYVFLRKGKTCLLSFSHPTTSTCVEQP